MKKADYLVIGGSAAGTTAAEVIRSLKPDSSITIVTDENHEQYSRVLLPHYIRHKVARDQVFLKKPQWYQEKKIALMKGVRACGLDSIKKIVSLDSGEQIRYGKLLIAIGGYVIKLLVAGADADNVLYMRTIEDADKIINLVSRSKRGVIIGGGFIGLEFTSCFKMNGVEDVKVLVMEDYYWQGKLDQESSKVLQNTLEKNGIKIFVNEEVDHFVAVSGHSRLDRESDPRFREDDKTVAALVTKSGKTFDADVVGVGIGIKSDLSWLEGSGIQVNRAIVTNEYLETNIPDVYAAGDCAEFKDVIFERQHVMGNWANATSQGSAVGKTMAHSASSRSLTDPKTVFETASSYSINFFDLPGSKAPGSCSFIGVTDSDFADEVISRGSVESGKMTRIFVKTIGGVMRVVGATVINNPAEVGPLTSAIKNEIDISKRRGSLNDPNFDLKKIATD